MISFIELIKNDKNINPLDDNKYTYNRYYQY